ncbi:ABC transporter ATP-binding protein [Streptomyces millisiae]|uniref:ABC transporter ATP-binding protein n=1 Tax=Streptomyces millisiae TaxID=3075542 RepID=A0ABU2M028_9ACTN|nr:ABC transporter ATP-binding protein [Streptomyces sp. DSM 44918]MDT0323197.1 ABC transporter ATP-binding protein [Streptomyces sp. DSM 44918]
MRLRAPLPLLGAAGRGGGRVNAPLLSVEGLVKHFPVGARSLIGRRSAVHSVDGVSFAVEPGEVLGLVGESGCGKTTLARAVLGLVRADRGRVVFDGADIAGRGRAGRRALRREMQLVFQDPHAALDPRMRLGTSLEAPLAQHGVGDRAERRARIAAVLEQVGLDESFLGRRPAECSGGQLQRVVVARALLLRPRFLVCDEPTSALDASIRAQILNLLMELKDRLGLTLLIISHDLRVVRHVCDRVAVMYLGQLVEVAARDDLFERPAHPYTRALLAASLPERPAPDAEFGTLRGEPPSPLDPPPGCRFRLRCDLAGDRCATEAPPPLAAGGPGHTVSCHYWDSRPAGPSSPGAGPHAREAPDAHHDR